MRITIRPALEPQREIDITHRLVSVIAEELWRLYGGNDQLNWVEAERHLQRIVDSARSDASTTDVLDARRPDATAIGETRRACPRRRAAARRSAATPRCRRAAAAVIGATAVVAPAAVARQGLSAPASELAPRGPSHETRESHPRRG